MIIQEVMLPSLSLSSENYKRISVSYNSKDKSNGDVVFLKTKQATFKGKNPQADEIFNELIKKMPDKADSINKIRDISEKIPNAALILDVANLLKEVSEKKYDKAAIGGLLVTIDNTVLLPVKLSFISIMSEGGKVVGGGVGAMFGGVGALPGVVAGGILGAVGGGFMWKTFRDTIRDGILDISNGSQGGSSGSFASDGDSSYSSIFSDDDYDSEQDDFGKNDWYLF